jgi:hypothetical protein
VPAHNHIALYSHPDTADVFPVPENNDAAAQQPRLQVEAYDVFSRMSAMSETSHMNTPRM